MQNKSQFIDYTKYRLKPESEILDIIGGVSSINLVICEKCYKVYDSDAEPECTSIKEILGKAGVDIRSCLHLPFLCNRRLTEKELSELKKGEEPVGVISCGIGIQSISGLMDKRVVYALADSMPQSGNATSIRGYHGIALGKEQCAACGQCYLDRTGGICPVADCAKSLLNGPCGGASEDGKCEVNHELPCAWIQIYNRLEEQGRRFDNPVIIRDFSVFKPADSLAAINDNRARRTEGFRGGIYPAENKGDTEDLPIRDFPEPSRAVIFLSQHTGIPARLIVKEGDYVNKGQKIGEKAGLISAAVHSSVSGKVAAIEDRRHPVFLAGSPAVIIENDFKNTLCSSVKPVEDWRSLEKKEILDIIADKGVVGLGGAMFPSDVKLSPPRPVDTLVVNGCECEPFLNADNRLMIENSAGIFTGLEIAAYLLGVGSVVVGVEDNKPAAVEKMRELSDRSLLDIRVEQLTTKYPQGAEKMLIKRILRREVPPGCLPFDAGCVVMNVATLYSIYDAVCNGMPLIQRVVTISGESAERQGNFTVRVGTPFQALADFCFPEIKKEVIERDYIFKMGGPLMGVVQETMDSFVVKGTGGITFLKNIPPGISRERDCIKCGRCADVCPADLYPSYYAYYVKRGLWEESERHNLKSCIECGACNYICSSKIDIVSLIKEAKKNVNNKT